MFIQRDIYNSINLQEGDQVIINGIIAKTVARYPAFVRLSKYENRELFSVANTDITNRNTKMIQLEED